MKSNLSVDGSDRRLYTLAAEKTGNKTILSDFDTALKDRGGTASTERQTSGPPTPKPSIKPERADDPSDQKFYNMAADRQNRIVDLENEAASLNYTIASLGTSSSYVTQALQADLAANEHELAALSGTSSAAAADDDTGDDNVVAAGPQNVEIGGATYQLGPTPPPDIRHDNGFLQNRDDPNDPVPIPTREPTQEEIDYYNGQRRNAGIGNIVSGIPGAGFFDSRADLDNGIDHYRHFLNGGGEPYVFDYGEYISEDVHGRRTRDSALEDIRSAGDEIYAGLVDGGDVAPGETVTFNVTSDAIPVNEDVRLNPDARYPYPESENWQKAIGAHHVWSSSEVTVTRLEDGRLLARADVTLNAEDRYNFNPGQKDIATEVPDDERGVLEESGLAHQFDQGGTAQYTTEWIIGEPGTPDPDLSEGTTR